MSADDISLISDVGGNVKIQGKTAQAHAKTIEHIGGNILICGMEVDNLDDVHGNIRLVNSKVHDINLVGGSVRQFGDSEVGSVHRVNGNFD